MTLEAEFTAELAERYRSEGWEVQDPAEAESVLNFEPDLLLRRGDEHLVVEVKRVGFVSGRAVSVIRKQVEAIPNWQFELKLIPPDRMLRAARPVEKEIRDRIDVAQKLATEGFDSEAFILTWTAVEAVLRDLLDEAETDRSESIADLFRRAYEEGAITDAELRQLQRGFQVRNRLVHGFAVDEARRNVEELMPLTVDLMKRAEGTLRRAG